MVKTDNNTAFCGIAETSCGFGEPLTGMFKLTKKLKPSFGGRSGSTDSNEEIVDVNEDGAVEVATVDPEREEVKDERDSDSSIDKDESTPASLKQDNTDGDNNEEEKEEDVHEMLDNLEIPDFNLSVDFDAIDDSELTGAVDYDKRMRREEVYSKRYHPSKKEKEELQTLAADLSESSSSFRVTSSANALQDLLFGNHSIILKKGPISSKEEDCILYLLTDGFILAYANVSVFNPLGSRYEACHYWADVDYVDIVTGTLLIQMGSGEKYELHAMAGGDSLKDWFQAIEIVALQNIIRDKNQSELTQVFGWQYGVMRKPGFTAAVTGDMKLMGNPRNLNELDTYNQSAPLHYAMQHEPCNATMVDALLRLGADPNLPDGDGQSAMYFAMRNKLDDIERILKENGGKESKLAEMEMRGELFGGVEQAQRKTEKRRENEKAIKDQKAAEAAAKSEGAMSQMSKNMRAMIERGEKIEEMDDKARQINDQAKEYGNMAAELKNHYKKKKWYQL